MKHFILISLFLTFPSFTNTKVGGSADVKDNVRIYGNAVVGGGARVSGDVKVFGNAVVGGYARVDGDIEISGDTEIYSWGSQSLEECRDRTICDNLPQCSGVPHCQKR